MNPTRMTYGTISIEWDNNHTLTLGVAVPHFLAKRLHGEMTPPQWDEAVGNFILRDRVDILEWSARFNFPAFDEKLTQKGGSRREGIAAYIRGQGWIKARRSQQYQGHAESGSMDVVCGNFPFAVECKRCQQLKPEIWLERAIQDCPKGKIPSVWFRRNGSKRWLVLLSADDVCQIARDLAPPLMEKPTYAEPVAHTTSLVVQGQMISTPTTNPNKT